MFAERILGIEVRIAKVWGALQADARRKGLSLSATDGLIAATAACHGLTLVTRNEKDFLVTGVAMVNPWLGP